MHSYVVLSNVVLDVCFGNDICGKHGRCISTSVAFRCSCYFYTDGPLCNKGKGLFLYNVREIILSCIRSFVEIYTAYNWYFDNSIYFHYVTEQTTSGIPKIPFQKAQ